MAPRAAAQNIAVAVRRSVSAMERAIRDEPEQGIEAFAVVRLATVDSSCSAALSLFVLALAGLAAHEKAPRFFGLAITESLA